MIGIERKDWEPGGSRYPRCLSTKNGMRCIHLAKHIGPHDDVNVNSWVGSYESILEAEVKRLSFDLKCAAEVLKHCQWPIAFGADAHAIISKYGGA